MKEILMDVFKSSASIDLPEKVYDEIVEDTLRDMKKYQSGSGNEEDEIVTYA